MPSISTAKIAKLGAALLGGVALAIAPAAVAGAAPTVNSVFCESGASKYICDLDYSGAQNPVTIQWYVNGVYTPSLDGRTIVNRGCSPGTRFTVQATVTDSTGSSTGSHSFVCRKIWQ
ncbi:hypothetical protein [Melissospora conviva]|uniref:hypothetical protein n=1 Tax=Melissospora conviva TaxID=3388432 RepID=UPI003C16B58D